MKILKLLNNKNLSITIISLLLSFSSIAEEKPVDIWNIDKKENQNILVDIILPVGVVQFIIKERE